MSNDKTGILWVPGFAGLLGVREDGASVYFGSTTPIVVTSLQNVAGEFDQFVPASGKVLTLSNTLTLAGTDGTTMTFPSTSGTVATLGLANTWSADQTVTTAANGGQLTIETSSGGTNNHTALLRYRANSSIMGYVGRTTASGGMFGILDGSAGAVLIAGGLGVDGTWNSLICLGGVTSSFPALKRSTTALEVKLADDSAYTHLRAATLALTAPVTETGATHTVAATTTHLIANRAGDIVVTLPAASSFPGRELIIKTIQAQTVTSNASNVVPHTSATAGTAILPATDGAWVLLVSDGTNWISMAGSPLV